MAGENLKKFDGGQYERENHENSAKRMPFGNKPLEPSQSRDAAQRTGNRAEQGGMPQRSSILESPISRITLDDSQGVSADPQQILFYLKTILGYKIIWKRNTVLLRSVYAFSEEDVFEMEIHENRIVIKNTDYLSEWTDFFNTYIVNGRSYSAFFAAVTLELFNRKTFG
ncbi:hypothetical protein ENBRE01_3363 [Enteropsectra breve]|nr:hypothetical protein ENBRE01_3363 [Enteropsectra breve]